MKKLLSHTLFQLITLFLFATGGLCFASKILSSLETETPFKNLVFFGYACLINAVVLIVVIFVGVILKMLSDKK